MNKNFLTIGITTLIVVGLGIFLYGCKTQPEPTSEPTSTTVPTSEKYIPSSEISKLYPEGNCCCKFLTDDIMNEELMLVSECQTIGKCIEVNPLRSTPHSCCPNAPGESCESLIK